MMVEVAFIKIYQSNVYTQGDLVLWHTSPKDNILTKKTNIQLMCCELEKPLAFSWKPIQYHLKLYIQCPTFWYILLCI